MHCSPFLCLSLSAPPFTGAAPRGHFSLSLPVLQPAAYRQVSSVCPWAGVGPLYVRIHVRPQCLATTHMCRGVLLHRVPGHLFPHPISGGQTLP